MEKNGGKYQIVLSNYSKKQRADSLIDLAIETPKSIELMDYNTVLKGGFKKKNKLTLNPTLHRQQTKKIFFNNKGKQLDGKS